jgi:CheY-like chemotaxis protein
MDTRSLPPRRILVVDDNPDAASTLAQLLELIGNETRMASDGTTALAVGAEFRPHVVLLDLAMPRLDGYATAQRIQAEDWGRDAALVALSGYGRDEDRQRSLEAGLAFHLVKPVELEALEQLLASHERTG